MLQPRITDNEFLDGFLWARAVMESRASVRATVSSRPFPLIDVLAAQAEAANIAVEFEEVGQTEDVDGSLAMRIRSRDDWTFGELRDPIGARRVSDQFSTEFLQGFFAGRCSMSGALYCSWNRASQDIQDTLSNLGVDFAVEHETIRIRGAAGHEEFAPYLAARKEERTMMVDMPPGKSPVSEGPAITDSGWLYWEDLAGAEHEAYLELTEALELGPKTFADLHVEFVTDSKQEVPFRVAVGRALKTTDAPPPIAKIRKVHPRLLEGTFKRLRKRYPVTGFTAIYVLQERHSPAMQCFALLAANREHVDDTTKFWQAVEASAAQLYGAEAAGTMDWQQLSLIWQRIGPLGPDWSALAPNILFQLPPEKIGNGQDVEDFAAALLGVLGRLGSAGFEVDTDKRTPFVYRLLEWVEARSGVPGKLRVETDGDNSRIRGFLSLPTRVYDILRLGPDAMDRNPHFQNGLRSIWMLDSNDSELPAPYNRIRTDELVRPEKRSSIGGYIPKYLKEDSM